METAANGGKSLDASLTANTVAPVGDATQDGTGETPRAKPLVFISHRTTDEKIASQFAEWISASCAGRVDVFQSSHGLRGPSISRSITDEIRRAVAKAAVMIVIYTDQDADWAWVMFEMGIAMDPTMPVTNVVVVQCADDYPRVLTDFRRVQVIQEADRLSFAKEFLTTKFFPTHPDFIVAATPEDGYAKERAADLWTRLKEHVPPLPRKADWAPHPVIVIEVPLRGRPTESMEVEKWLDMLRAVVRDEGKVTAEYDLAGVFVVAALAGRNLTELVGLLAAADQHLWIEALIRELAWCMADLRPQRSVDRLRGTTGIEFQPVVTRIQDKWFDKIAKFDVHLLPVNVIMPNLQ